MFMNLYRLVSVFKDYFGELEERLLKPLNLHISHCLRAKLIANSAFRMLSPLRLNFQKKSGRNFQLEVVDKHAEEL
jgi:hypothetical protein